MTAVATPGPISFIERLIREARQRARRRRLWIGTGALAVTAVAAVSYTQLSRSSAAVATCRTSDYRLSTGSQGSTGNLIAGVDFADRSANTCRLAAEVTFSVVGSDGSLLPIPGNPGHWHAGGTLTRTHEIGTIWGYGPWCESPAVTFVAHVAGGPTVRSSNPAAASKCDGSPAKQLVRIQQP